MDKPVFDPAFWRELAEENPLGRLNVTARDAHDWFDYVWPVMREYTGNATTPQGMKRRVVVWWHRLHPNELEKARDRGASLRRSDRAEYLNETASKSLPPNQQLRTDLPPLNMTRGRGSG